MLQIVRMQVCYVMYINIKHFTCKWHVLQEIKHYNITDMNHSNTTFYHYENKQVFSSRDIKNYD